MRHLARLRPVRDCGRHWSPHAYPGLLRERLNPCGRGWCSTEGRSRRDRPNPNECGVNMRRVWSLPLFFAVALTACSDDTVT